MRNKKYKELIEAQKKEEEMEKAVSIQRAYVNSLYETHEKMLSGLQSNSLNFQEEERIRNKLEIILRLFQENPTTKIRPSGRIIIIDEYPISMSDEFYTFDISFINDMIEVYIRTHNSEVQSYIRKIVKDTNHYSISIDEKQMGVIASQFDKDEYGFYSNIYLEKDITSSTV